MTQPTQRRSLVTEIPGPQSKSLQAWRDEQVSGGLGMTMPVFVERAGGAILVDVDGNHIIDFASGIAVTGVGASHPAVVHQIVEQAKRFSHTCFAVTEYVDFVGVAAQLNHLTPGGHAKKTALYTTGAEAVENAVKVARVATGRAAVVVLSHAYHGRTLMTMTMTAKNAPYKQGFGPFAPEIYRVPSPYAYRWPSGADRCRAEAVDALRETVLTQIGPKNVAAIVVEPIQGEGGFIVPPPGYLSDVQEFAAEHGIIFVADEVQTGFARTGEMFACDHEGVVPDIVVTAKALGAGLPLSAITGRADLMDAVPQWGLGGTYSGNPIACAAALAALATIEEENLVQKARDIEARALPRLQALAGPDSIVGDVRGKGAMLALEFVKPGTQEPAPETMRAVMSACHSQGVLTISCGTYGNVIRLLPPLVIDHELLDDGLDVLTDAVRAAS